MPRIVLLFATSAFLISCTASIQNTVKVQYLKPGFTTQTLHDGGLALLPIIAGQGQEGYRRPLGESLDTSIAVRRPGMKYIRWQETLSNLNRDSLASSYESVIMTYRSTSIVDKSLIKKLGQSIGARYLFFVSLEDFSKSSRVGYSGLTGSLETQESAQVSAFAQIWDSEEGDVVWEATASAQSSSSEFTTISHSYEDYSSRLASSIAMKLP